MGIGLQEKRGTMRNIPNFLASFYALIWGQCTLVLRDKLRSHATFLNIEQQQNGLSLLKLIKTLTHTYDNTKIHNVDALDTYKWQYMMMKKHGHQSIADFYQQFQAHVQMCEEMDVQLYEPALALSVMAERGGMFVTEDDKQNAHRQAIAMRFIRACGHGEYLQHLQNSFFGWKGYLPKKNFGCLHHNGSTNPYTWAYTHIRYNKQQQQNQHWNSFSNPWYKYHNINQQRVDNT